MEDLLLFLARSLVEDADAVEIEKIEEEDAIILELTVGEDDVGFVIGRGGRTINALRTVMRAVGSRNDARVLVDVV